MMNESRDGIKEKKDLLGRDHNENSLKGIVMVYIAKAVQ